MGELEEYKHTHPPLHKRWCFTSAISSPKNGVLRSFSMLTSLTSSSSKEGLFLFNHLHSPQQKLSKALVVTFQYGWNEEQCQPRGNRSVLPITNLIIFIIQTLCTQISHSQTHSRINKSIFQSPETKLWLCTMCIFLRTEHTYLL